MPSQQVWKSKTSPNFCNKSYIGHKRRLSHLHFRWKMDLFRPNPNLEMYLGAQCNLSQTQWPFDQISNTHWVIWAKTIYLNCPLFCFIFAVTQALLLLSLYFFSPLWSHSDAKILLFRTETWVATLCPVIYINLQSIKMLVMQVKEGGMINHHRS